MRFFGYLLLGALLAGCASAPVIPPATNPQQTWQAHRADLARLDRWEIDGRIAVQKGNEGWHADIEWQQRGDAYDILISGPLGGGSVRLRGGNGHVTLRTSKGQTLTDSDPEHLLYRELGWRLPVHALRYWVLGLPAPGAAVWAINPQGFLGRLQQAGWSIEFRDYAMQGRTALPGRVFARSPGAQVRLVIDTWTL